MQRETLKVSGILVECFTAGQGKPVFILHDELGLAPDAEYLAILSKSRRVIAMSLPGFGQSELPLWMDSADDLSYIAPGFLDRLDLRTVDIIGCSFGGWVVAEMASKALPALDKERLLGANARRLPRLP